MCLLRRARLWPTAADHQSNTCSITITQFKLSLATVGHLKLEQDIPPRKQLKAALNSSTIQ
jgi:hypothetical protein